MPEIKFSKGYEAIKLFNKIIKQYINNPSPESEVLIWNNQSLLCRVTLTPYSSKKIQAEIYNGNSVNKTLTDNPKRIIEEIKLRSLENIICKFKGFTETNIKELLVDLTNMKQCLLLNE